MPLQATSGAASYDAFGGGAAVAPKYIEDFFQTWLRTGTGSSATVTTGLNASINKSLVWTKSRSAATNHKLTDTVRGATKALSSNTTSAEATDSQGLTAFSSTGYTIGTSTDYNNSGATYVDWQWLATPKFFDVVTYTGDGTTQNISHSLGSAPGCIIVKNVTSGSANWTVYHQSLGADYQLRLNLTDASNFSAAAVWGNNTTSVTPTSTQFTVGSNFTVNQSGATHVAYLFAHDAGGFGLSGTDNVISCGSFTTDGGGLATVDLGYEPQLVLYKSVNATGNWPINDVMRGWVVSSSGGGTASTLNANLSDAETALNQNAFSITPTGFNVPSFLGSSNTFIYIAIRRGPMKVPTTGTSVFLPLTRTGTGSTNTTVSSSPVRPDILISKGRSGPLSGIAAWYDRLRGPTQMLFSTQNSSESAVTNSLLALLNTTYTVGSDGSVGAINFGSQNYVNYAFTRAPGFVDEVCYTGTGSARTVTHNLAAVPELMIVKSRSTSSSWRVYSSAVGNTGSLRLNSDDSADTGTATYWNNTTPTSSVFTVGTDSDTNATGTTYLNYLFTTCPGVSKVGSYTGTGATQVINCGFTASSRFVLIKATSTTGAWYVWDSARGIVAGDDPYIVLNTTATEVTGTDWVDTAATGFELSNAGGNLVNSSGVSYIFLAVA